MLERVSGFAMKLLKGSYIRSLVAAICQWRCNRSVRKLSLRQDRVVRVAFLQMYATSNQNLRIFEMMMKDPVFDPYFIVNPDVSRSKENAELNYTRTIQELRNTYGKARVLDGISADGDYIDYSSNFDLMTTNNPYDNMAARPFRILYWTLRGVPSFYTSYFYMGRCRVSVENIKMLSASCLWRFFADNNMVVQMAKKFAVLHGRNFVLMGSPKMDAYENRVSRPSSKPVVLVAPHHSIGNVYPQNSAFLDYAHDLLDLMRTFSSINFIFRPHPLLFENLKKEEYWGVVATEDFMRQLSGLSNVTISQNGDYLQEFADSDALIHDCGSFSAEYLFTGKPCAYIVRASVDMSTFSELGRKCIEAHYQIHNTKDIVEFLDNVVRKGGDCMCEDRTRFAHEELMYNYPHVSEAIVNHVKKMLGR